MRETCDACHTQPAKNHLCEIIDGQQTSLDLCDDCLRARAADSGFQLPLLDGTQPCYYCGSPAQSAGKNQAWEQPVRGEAFHFSCFRCAELYREFISSAVADMRRGLSAQPQMDALMSAVAASDRQVYARVRDEKA